MLDAELFREECICVVVEVSYCRNSGVLLPCLPSLPPATTPAGLADPDLDADPEELTLTPPLSAPVVGPAAPAPAPAPSLSLLFSFTCAFSTSLATSDACAFFNVFFTNPVINRLHRKSTSSLNQSPSFGTLCPSLRPRPKPNSTTSRGSPGMLPPSVHLLRISTPIGANTCVCKPTARSWKQAV